MPRRILVSGASIAGNTLAWVLARGGVEVTVVERAPAFRGGGQNIDVRDVGREVIRRMGLEQAVLDHGTGEEGTAWIDEHGQPAATFRVDPDEGDADDGPTAEMEILRGDLARLIHDAVPDTVRFVFGDTIARIDDDADAALVTFDSGRSERFDAVVVAEGVGSTTRERVFPGENEPRWMDLTMAYFTIPRTATDDRLWRWYHATDGRSVSLRPDRHGTTRAMLCLQQPPDGEQDWSEERQRAWLHERFRDVGWEAPRVMAAMDTTNDFYFDVLRQVRMPRWANGRVVLTGDAAWCATPLAGIGSTLAVTGAYVLGQELLRHDDTTAAFSAYEAALRPMVEQGQGVPKIAPRLMNPHSRLGIKLLHGALKIASQPVLRSAADRLFSRDLDAPDLSIYSIGR
jgi:2-polyprenyl-6-methoxyphenol hydroxylase-like FAD-dependent oxidoreductase